MNEKAVKSVAFGRLLKGQVTFYYYKENYAKAKHVNLPSIVDLGLPNLRRHVRISASVCLQKADLVKISGS